MSATSSNDSSNRKASPVSSRESSDAEDSDHEEDENDRRKSAAAAMEAEANRRQLSKSNPEMEKILNDVDNDKMWDECGIVKPRGGYRQLYDWQKTKIYEWQLARDEKLLREYNTSMQERNYKYINYRRTQSDLFNEIERPAYRTPNGNFEKIAAECAEVSWRATSHPMGHARLARIVPVYTGIPEEEVKERLRSGKPFSDQEIRERKRAYEREKLWNDLKSGRIPVDDDDEPVEEEEEVKVNSDEEEEDAAEMEKERQANVAKAKAKADAGSADGSDPSSSNDGSPAKAEVVTRDSKMGERVRKRRAIASGNFASLRYYTSLKERTESLHNWNHGNNADFDYNNGFPEVTGLDDAPRKENVRVSEDEKYRKFLAGQISAKIFIKKKDQMETLYVRFREKHMIIRAKKLVEDRREAEREAQAKHELQRQRKEMEASRFAASAAKHTTARTGKGAGTGKGGGSGTGSGGGSVSSLRNNIFKTSAFSLSRKHMHVPPLPGIGQGSGEFDDMSYDDPGQGSGAASDQGLDVWDGPPGHAAATAKAAGKTRMEKERDEALKKTIAKKLPHNVGNSRSPLLLPPVAPAVATSVQDGIDGSPMTLKDGKGEELGFPYPPANTPMIASTPDQTARSRQSEMEGGWWPTYNANTGAWGSVTVPTLMSPGADADDEASPTKTTTKTTTKKGGKTQQAPKTAPLSRAARRRAKTREIKVLALSPAKRSTQGGTTNGISGNDSSMFAASDDGSSSNGGFSNSVSNSVSVSNSMADFSVGSWTAASVTGGGIMTTGGLGPISPTVTDTFKTGAQLVRSLEKLELMDEQEREREKNGGLFSPDGSVSGSVSGMDDSIGDDSSHASIKKQKKLAKKLEKAARKALAAGTETTAAEKTNSLSIDTARWKGDGDGGPSALTSPSYSNFHSPQGQSYSQRGQGLGPFIHTPNMSPLALSPSSFTLKFSATLTSTLNKLRSPLSRKGREEIQAAAEVAAKRAAQASMVAAQAAMELTRDQFRSKLKILTTAISATDTGQDLAVGYKEYLKHQNKTIHTFEAQFEKLTGVKIKLLSDGKPKKTDKDIELEAFGNVVGALLEQQQMEELEKALLDEKAVLDEREFVENLYKIRAREMYRANFVYTQLDKVLTNVQGGEANQVYAPEDLIRASRRGDWRKVIDIMEHLYYPVSPNAVDPISRQTATFATLLSILTRSGGDALLLDIDLTPAKRFFNYVKSFVYKEQSRVDWVVKILLDQGGDINFMWEDRGEDGCTLLHKAAELGNFGYLKWLLKRGAIGRTRTSRDGITPLMFACRHDHIDMVLHLLEFGDSMAIINWSDEMGNTCLHYACQGGSALLVEVLLMCGVKMPQRNNHGEMAIDIARIRLADDIANVMTRYTNRVKEVEIRMHFNSLIFPKEGFLNMGEMDFAFKDIEIPVGEEESGVEGGEDEQSMMSADSSLLLNGGLYPLAEDVQGELNDA